MNSLRLCSSKPGAEAENEVTFTINGKTYKGKIHH